MSIIYYRVKPLSVAIAKSLILGQRTSSIFDARRSDAAPKS